MFQEHLTGPSSPLRQCQITDSPYHSERYQKSLHQALCHLRQALRDLDAPLRSLESQTASHTPQDLQQQKAIRVLQREQFVLSEAHQMLSVLDVFAEPSVPSPDQSHPTQSDHTWLSDLGQRFEEHLLGQRLSELTDLTDSLPQPNRSDLPYHLLRFLYIQADVLRHKLAGLVSLGHGPVQTLPEMTPSTTDSSTTNTL